MWFMNKIANPFVSLILRSPLHGMMSASLLLITYRGRKSGKEYTLPVQYMQDNHTLTILPGAPARKTWWRNLCGGAPVQIVLRGRRLQGQAKVLDGAQETGQVAGVLGLVLQKHPAVASAYAIHPGADGCFSQADLQQAALSVLVVRVELER